MKKLLCSIVLVLVLSAPALAILKSEWIPQESNMGQVDAALKNFASNHPDADVKSMQIISHPISGSYDIFILYNE